MGVCRVWLAAVMLAVLLGGCGPTARTGSAPVPPADPGPALSRFDGFEGDAVAPFWRSGDAGSGRYAPGAVGVTSEYARAGKQSVRITVREGDVEQQGDDGEANERAELDSGKVSFPGRDLWYGFSVLVPPGFPVVDTRLVVAQWKQEGLKGGPLVAQRYRSGKHHLTVRDWATPEGDRKHFPLPPVVPGRWIDMVYHLRLSSAADGLVEVWADGVRVVSHEGPTASGGGGSQVYNKIGLYRDRMREPMTIYFDNYTVGDSFAAVDPARFDRKP
jgi:hypothetical protein